MKWRGKGESSIFFDISNICLVLGVCECCERGDILVLTLTLLAVGKDFIHPSQIMKNKCCDNFCE